MLCVSGKHNAGNNQYIIFGFLNTQISKSDIVVSDLIKSVYVRDNVLSGGHYPKINPDGANSTPTRSAPLIIRLLAKTIEDIPPTYLFLMI